MNIQEIEEMEFEMGRQSEAQNCLQEATQGIQHAQLIGEGRFELTVEHVVFCRATDAIAGSAISHRERFETREEAEARAGVIIGTEEYNEYERAMIRDLEPPVVVDTFVDGEDIPF
tara:strand:- start:272 stop:619 length:348 start_codon:yes stop_codon:yes gene_type:complete